MGRFGELKSTLRTTRGILSAVVIALGAVSLVLGIVFIVIGASTHSYLRDEMRREQITLGIPDSQLAAGEVIDTADKAQLAGDIVRSHRHQIAPTYGDLLGEERFDPTDPQQLTYAQALNLENYLYLAVASFGLANVAIGAGVGMLVLGIAIILLALLLLLRPRRDQADYGGGPVV